MAEYKFPAKAMVKILAEEWDSSGQIKALVSFGIWVRLELRHIIYEQEQRIKSLSTYEEINTYLLEYRGLSLQEWVDSL